MTEASEAKRLTDELLTQRRGAEPKATFDTLACGPGAVSGAVGSYIVTWGVRVGLDDPGVVDVFVEPKSWVPARAGLPSTALMNGWEDSILTSAARLIYEAVDHLDGVWRLRRAVRLP